MATIIKLPDKEKSQNPMMRRPHDGDCAEILFFTGVRYERTSRRKVKMSRHTPHEKRPGSRNH